MKNQEYGCGMKGHQLSTAQLPTAQLPMAQCPTAQFSVAQLPTAFHSKTEPDFQTVAFP